MCKCGVGLIVVVAIFVLSESVLCHKEPEEVGKSQIEHQQRNGTSKDIEYMESKERVEEQVTEEGVENGDISWMFPKIESQLFSEEEKSQIEASVLSVAKKVWKYYEHVKISEDTTYNSDIIGFTKEQRIAVVTALGENNVIATSENVNMVHGEKLEAFYQNYKDHKEDMVTIYDIYEDGLIATITFLYRKDEIQAYYVAVKPDKNGNPYLTGRIVHEIEFINLTEKGYFFYANKFHLSHSSLCQYWRVSSLSEKCRELTEKYLQCFDFQKYNLMVIDWNKDNIVDVLQPGLFEDLYFMKYGKCFQGDNEEISGKLFEEIMTAYLPVTVEQLRTKFRYNESDDTYYQNTVYGSPYPPFLEVVDYQENTDGTITLYADGVWPDFNSDYAFTNKIVIQPAKDGTFRILSNDVEEQELEFDR